MAATTSVAYHADQLILAQKNGVVVSLTLKANDDDVTIDELRVIHVEKKNSSKISVLSVSDEGRLFVGFNDGTVRVFDLKKGGNDLGSVWEDEDNVPVTEVVPVVGKDRVILVKGCHVVVVSTAMEQELEVAAILLNTRKYCKKRYTIPGVFFRHFTGK